MTYDTSAKERSMRNIQHKAGQVAAACRDRELSTDDITTVVGEIKPGFFARMMGKSDQVIADRKVFGWYLPDRMPTYEEEVRRPGVNLVKTEWATVYLTTQGEVILVEEKQIENYLNGYTCSSV